MLGSDFRALPDYPAIMSGEAGDLLLRPQQLAIRMYSAMSICLHPGFIAAITSISRLHHRLVTGITITFTLLVAVVVLK
ncbi:MAG: hypothetical protein OJJ21_09555 [Ferrovibrio sp.]|uniref:hypothetical protein n=1 Tax=Ferrovibrio sp. TaxID=1917215 RepID=UPI00262CD1BC|nr:hypothetical protein [Ferrovibrio sp.]MCW0233830.1 hypothetical protein [Ferrovibrio sp.]